MLKQRIEMKLPDDTTLIAESNQQSDYPSINIYHKDTDGEVDEVAFAEYNTEKEIGRRLMVAAYQNDDDDTKYYKSYRHLFKPSFNELNQAYKECEENDFRILRNNFTEIVNVSNDLVIYRDFNYDNDKLKDHIGHKIVLAGYGGESGIENISIECEDCCEVLYSADRITLLSNVYQFRKPRNMLYINCFAQEGINLKDCGCVGRVTVIFGGGKDQCKMIWEGKNESLQTEKFFDVYDELMGDYLRYNILKNTSMMKKYCDESDFFVKTENNQYVTQIATNDYTFFIRLIPSEKNAKAYIYAYANEILYNTIEPVKLPVTTDIDCEATVTCVKHLDRYQNPKIGYLDSVEDECWRLFKEYASFVGVEFGDGIDFSIVKEISEKFINVVEKAFGIDFPMSKGG